MCRLRAVATSAGDAGSVVSTPARRVGGRHNPVIPLALSEQSGDPEPVEGSGCEGTLAPKASHGRHSG